MTNPMTNASQGIHSEVGRLRRVLVCRPGLAQRRLTPANCRELLFDDVLWVSQACNDHDAFVNAMQNRDVEVLELHDLLATTVADPVARNWLLDRKLGPGTVDTELAQQLRPWLEGLPPLRLAEHLIGGLARAE
jgi:arginine deiminase